MPGYLVPLEVVSWCAPAVILTALRLLEFAGGEVVFGFGGTGVEEEGANYHFAECVALLGLCVCDGHTV